MNFMMDPNTMGLLGAAGGLLQAGGASRLPVNMGQAMGQGLMGGMQGYQQGMQFQGQQEVLDAQKRKQNAIEQFARTLPADQQQRFLADPAAYIKATTPKAPEPFTLPAGGMRFGPDGKPIASAPMKPDPSPLARLMEEQRQFPPGTPQWQTYQQAIERASTHSPAVNVTNNLGKDDDEYLKGRRKQQADAFSQLEKGAESAYKQIQTIDRFLEASKKGTAGGAQPVISGVQNFLSSFGYSPEQLKDVRVMEQAIGDILGNKMSELGARGLTDKDMEILRQALPRVAIDRGSREEVSKILRKSHEFSLEQYEAARAEEERIYPDFAKKTPVQGWLKDYRARKAIPPAPPTPDAPKPPVVNWNDLGR